MTSRSSHETKPLNILSLDGGGVRGLSTLLILERIMEKSHETSGLHPCDVFDLICGTSTGGLIALMLGRLRMSVRQCIDAYVDFSKDIFGKKRPFAIARKVLGRSVYDHNALTKKVEKLVAEYSSKVRTMQDPRGEECCRTFVLAANRHHAGGSPRFFRTYRHDGQRQAHDDCHIWEAVRATSAASTFFDPITIGNPPEEFIDGALGKYNNPSYIAIGEASSLWPQRPIGLHLSIGTGARPLIRFSGYSWSILQECQKLVTNCDDMHQMVSLYYHMQRTNNPLDPYCRFSVDQGLELIGLDEYKKMGKMTTATRAYIYHADRRRDLEKVVQVLAARAAEVVAEEATEVQEEATEQTMAATLT